MQPFTDALAQKALTPQIGEITIGEYSYRVDLTPGAPSVRERGPQGEKTLLIAHAMGGKNVYYFLTPADRGMLQTLPLAYDVRRKEWFDVAKSGMRHVTGGPDRPINWRERPYTFNTSCYGCHVSQLSTNYDPGTDSYHTTWAEPGINCETCHGPSSEHARVFREAPANQPPADMRIIRTKIMSKAQRNDLCAPCHAKMQPITASFMPGDRYFDHFGLVTLEDPDFYPDGRDLGENYTFTSWLMSPCAQSGQLDCMFCHTSSGRYRFKDAEKANNACAPCHQDKVDAPAAHTHHNADGEGSKCISCHMPATEFARMVRHDHSMRPPTPAATIQFKSPNACNICHADKDAAWSDKHVREWRTRDYQAPVLERAGLIDSARKRDWTRLTEMMGYILREKRDEVTAASLIRLLAACDSPEKWPGLLKALNDPSPLVRASAAEALEGFLTPDSVPALLKATRDDYRLVRVRAADALAALSPGDVAQEDRESLAKAGNELDASLRSRPDDFASHYNLGILHEERREYEQALAEYEWSMKLNPGGVAPLVNMALLHSQQGQLEKAEDLLRRAITNDPRSAPAQFNLGLLLAETDRIEESESCLRKALEIEPHMAQAAYNLGVMLAQQDRREGLDWCRKAWTLLPSEPKYGYTLAFYQAKTGDEDAAVATLTTLVERSIAYPEAYAFLGRIYEHRGDKGNARAVYRRASEVADLSPEQRAAFTAKAAMP